MLDVKLNATVLEIIKIVGDMEKRVIRRKNIQITWKEFNTLFQIKQNPGIRMSDLAKKLHITYGTLTTAIKAIEAKGFCKRVKDKNDRRSNRVHLTQQGESAGRLYYSIHAKIREKLEAELTTAEIEQVNHLTQKALEILKN